MKIKLTCYILIAILQCTLDKDLSDCISNKKSKVDILFRNNKVLLKLKNDSDIFEQSILENKNLQNHIWVKQGLYEICETDFKLCDINFKDTSILDISTGTGFNVIRSEQLLRKKCEGPVDNIKCFSVIRSEKLLFLLLLF